MVRLLQLLTADQVDAEVLRGRRLECGMCTSRQCGTKADAGTSVVGMRLRGR